MVLVNTDYVTNKELITLGIVKGITVYSKHLKIWGSISQAFKSLIGGELNGYNDMINEARAIAIKRMVTEAEALNADAIVNIRYASSSIKKGIAEVMVYGTAVKFVRN